MKISDLSARELTMRLRQSGVPLKTGPLTFSIRSSIPSVQQGIRRLYASYEVAEPGGFVDYYISLTTPRTLRRWLRPQVEFKFDGRTPFKPLPINQAFPMLEWGMNWCIANHNYQWLILHAAVIERDGRAVIMPAPPGTGKSTLCAGLVGKGWRLLSDELAIIEHESGKLIPMPRPVSLKNESINIVKKYLSNALFGPVWKDTRKGTISHMAVCEEDSVNTDLAVPTWIVFPKYKAKSEAKLNPLPKANSLLSIAQNSFNYDVTGLKGFETISRMINTTESYEFTYSNLDDAITIFDKLGISEQRNG